jgi:hypothetical protein
LSTVAPPMAGLSKMPWWRFLGADGLGGLVWAGVYLGLGHIFREQLEDVAAYAARLGGWLIVVLGGALALWICWKYYQRRKFIKSLRVARILPEDLKLRLKEVFILDLRTAEEYQSDGAKIPGALWFDRKELEERHQEIPRDRDVILYCT